MNWIILAIVTAGFYAAYNVFIKVSSGHINQIVGALILQIAAAAVGGAILVFLKMTNTPLIISQKGIWFSILAGVFVGLAEIASFFLFSKGISASIGIPIIVGGSILLGALFGFIFLKETLNLTHFFAIALIVIGVLILSTK